MSAYKNEADKKIKKLRESIMKKTMKKLLATVLLVTSIVTFAPKITVDAAQVEDVWHFDSIIQLKKVEHEK